MTDRAKETSPAGGDVKRLVMEVKPNKERKTMKILGTLAVLAGLGLGSIGEMAATTCPKDRLPMCPWVCDQGHRGEPVCSNCGQRHEPPHHRRPSHKGPGCPPGKGHCPPPHGPGHRGPGHPPALDISQEKCPNCSQSAWKCATCGGKVHAQRPPRP